jgi:hypothetical protein
MARVRKNDTLTIPKRAQAAGVSTRHRVAHDRADCQTIRHDSAASSMRKRSAEVLAVMPGMAQGRGGKFGPHLIGQFVARVGAKPLR